jgi:hypothetical protein
VCKKLVMFKWFVNINTQVIAPYNLTLFGTSYSITLLKCKNSWHKTSLHSNPLCKYLDRLPAEIQVIPSPAFGLPGRRATWPATQTQRNRHRPAWRVGEFKSRSYLELSQGGRRARPELRTPWDQGASSGRILLKAQLNIFTLFTHLSTCHPS